jgi:hypothetical protein
MVEFSSPFVILKPVDLAKGNHKVFYAINNRGNQQAISYFNFGRGGNNPLTGADVGDGFLMRLGYTIVDAGWEGDLVPGNGRLVPKFPIATQPDGKSIVAKVRIEYSDRTIPEKGTFTLPLEGAANFKAYPAADTNTAHATLTVRDSVRGPQTAIPADQWAFGTCPTGKASLAANDTNICLFDGFRADRLYELVYAAKDPIVMGLAYAVTRDIGSFLRYETKDAAGNPNPLTGITRIYSFGGSQSGEYQREFLLPRLQRRRGAPEGAGRAVGSQVGHASALCKRGVCRSQHVRARGGPARLPGNERSAVHLRRDDRSDLEDSRWSRETAPDRSVRLPDRYSERVLAMKDSLNVVDGRGNAVPVPNNVRLYLLSSLQHGGNNPPRSFPGESGACENPTNPVYHGPTLRALLMALDAWADKGVKPPDSNYPTLQAGTLVSIDEARRIFPKIPGVNFPMMVNGVELLDFGPGFKPEGGRLTQLRQRSARAKTSTFRSRMKTASMSRVFARWKSVCRSGTHTGWNVRKKESRGPDLCELAGSFMPFAVTKEQRTTAGDPRKSLQERYGSHDGYVNAVRDAAKSLVVRTVSS